MTLDTRVYVLDKVDVREMFLHCQTLLQRYDEDGRGPAEQKWSDEESAYGLKGRRMANRIGQGLPAILDVSYRHGAQYRSAQHAAVHEYCNHPDSDYYHDDEPTCTETEHDPVCWAEISLDTAYGYRGPNSMGCGDLHAVLVAEIGRWLDARGVPWKWRNEFTGEVHDDARSLIELVSGGFAATSWYQTCALPAILAHVAEGSTDGHR